MTAPAQQVEQPADPGLSALDVLIAAIVAHAVLTFDGVVGDGLVEDLPPWAIGVLADALGLLLAVGNAAARSTAVEDVAGATGEPVEVPLPEPVEDVARLTEAVEVLLDRAVEQQTPAAPPSPARETTEEQRAADRAFADAHRRRREKDLARLRREAERERARQVVEDARALAAAERALAAAERRAAREDARAARADAREVERIRRADERAAERDRRRDQADAARIASQDAARDAENEAALAERRRLREERRQSQRARVERLAVAEAYRAADEAAQQAAERAPAVLGWVRVLGPNACPTCRAWWDERPFGVVRPMSVRMKRHPGCDCRRHLVTSTIERDARGTTDRPERVSERWRRARDRERAAARAEAGADAPG